MSAALFTVSVLQTLPWWVVGPALLLMPVLVRLPGVIKAVAEYSQARGRSRLDAVVAQKIADASTTDETIRLLQAVRSQLPDPAPPSDSPVTDSPAPAVPPPDPSPTSGDPAP